LPKIRAEAAAVLKFSRPTRRTTRMGAREDAWVIDLRNGQTNMSWRRCELPPGLWWSTSRHCVHMYGSRYLFWWRMRTRLGRTHEIGVLQSSVLAAPQWIPITEPISR
jgi:hypothetical protein